MTASEKSFLTRFVEQFANSSHRKSCKVPKTTLISFKRNMLLFTLFQGKGKQGHVPLTLTVTSLLV